MTKEELKTGLRNAGVYHRFDSSNYWWKQAFKMWASETGMKPDMGCSTCIRKVKEWIEK